MLWLIERKGMYKVTRGGLLAILLMNQNILVKCAPQFSSPELLEQFEQLKDSEFDTVQITKELWEQVNQVIARFALNHLRIHEEATPYVLFDASALKEGVILIFDKEKNPDIFKKLSQRSDILDITTEFFEFSRRKKEEYIQLLESEPAFMIETLWYLTICDRTVAGLAGVLLGTLKLLKREYLQKNAEIWRPRKLQKTIQPLNLKKTKERNITLLTLEHSFNELAEKYPERLETLRKFLSEDHEILLPPVQTIHEQMLIDIIAQIVHGRPADLIRIYLKPADIKYDYHDNIIVIGRRELAENFKLTDEEFKKIFIGRSREPSAVDRLNGRPFAIRNQHGELILDSLIRVNKLNAPGLSLIEIKPHSVFLSYSSGFVKDNLWKLRKLKEMANPKAMKAILALRNKLITLNHSLEFSFETLAGYAGLSSRKDRKWTKVKKQINEYLKLLRKIGDIDFEILDDKVRIWRFE